MILNPYLKEFWRTKSQVKILYGGRMSSKTEDTAGILAYLASTYKLRVACLRRFQNKIDESVYKTLKRKILDDDYLNPLYDINQTSIRSTTGSEFVFMGIQRNLEEIKGLDDVDITWIEEGEKLTREQWDLIRPTILRKENSFVVIVFNPHTDTDYVYKEFVNKKHENVLVKKINYDDNPFLSDSAKDLIRIDKMKMDENDFNNIYLGLPKSENEQSLIKRSWLYECIDAHIKLGIEPMGIKVIGYDVADDGGDSNAAITRHGCLVYECEEWNAKEHELNKSAIRVYNKAIEIDAQITFDSIGVGAGVGSKFKELNDETNNQVTFNKFNAGGGVRQPEQYYMPKIKNKDHFSNIKAQEWVSIADRLKITYNAIVNKEPFEEDDIISLSSELPNLERLIIELSTPLKDYDNNGRVKVESKKDLKKRGIDSPNCFVAGTKILTPNGNIPIEKIKVGDRIITPMGISKVAYTHSNYSNEVITNMGLTGTGDHKIFTWNKGWVPLRILSLCDTLEVSPIGRIKWQIMNLLFTKAKCSQFSTRVDIIVQEGTAGKTLEMKDFYTGGYGLIITAKFLTVTTSTISMVIGKIIKLKTFIASMVQNIKDYICSKDLKMTGSLSVDINTKDAQRNVRSKSSAIVYNLTLDHHNVYYANGVLVKNCADALIMAFAKPSGDNTAIIDYYKNLSVKR
jgi:phage terminase large subunit